MMARLTKEQAALNRRRQSDEWVRKERRRNYRLILAAARVGARAPQSAPFGPLDSGITASLAKAGRIKIEVFAHNWRVITIMKGCFRGEHTQRRPGGGKPYKIVYLDHFIPRRAAQ